MKLLALDTASASASAALFVDGLMKAEMFAYRDRQHSLMLMPMIEDILDGAGTTVNEIDALAVTCGPGSFTGVRIGVATVKGLALAVNTPCVKVNSLLALCWNVPFTSGHIACLMDARRNQVYAACFKWEGDEPLCVLPESAIDINEFIAALSDLKGGVVFVGDGAGKHFELARQALGHRARLAPAHLLALRASSVAACAGRMMERGEAISGEMLAPHYLRESSAERLFKERSGG